MCPAGGLVAMGSRCGVRQGGLKEMNDWDAVTTEGRMQVDLLYGDGTIPVSLEETWSPTLVRKHPSPVPSEPAAVVRDALQQAVGCDSLDQLARGARTACIAICDVTRPVPNHLFLAPMIRTLLKEGIAPENITVVVATGLHRPNEGDELAALVGDSWVLETVPVVNHFARESEDHVDLGVTSGRGTPVRIDRRFVDGFMGVVTGIV